MLILPDLPAALEDEDVGEGGLVAETAGDVMAGLATEAAAIDDDFARGVPVVEDAGEEIVPAVFIEGDGAGDVGVGKIGIGTGIDPEDGGAPGNGGGKRDFIGLPAGTARMPEGCERGGEES